MYVRDARSPTPSSDAASRIMSANRARDTSPERALREALWRAGLRGYRLNASGVPGRPDIAFHQAKLAIFVHGCFWHACPEHAHAPKSNARFWEEKFARNRERDARKLGELHAAGWRTIVVWEHDIPAHLDAIVRDVRHALHRSP
jgi:DNA mismatch endonuclease (patch repair protein)